MDIRDWPLDKIMQLPDWCFGSRNIRCLGDEIPAAGARFVLDTFALPDECVIWEIRPFNRFSIHSTGNVGFHWYAVLADKLPVTFAEFTNNEWLFGSTGVWVGNTWAFTDQFGSVNMRQPIRAMGRRLCIYLVNSGTIYDRMGVLFVVSSVPKEVPDWLFSGQARGL